jgi:hypothetical protein
MGNRQTRQAGDFALGLGTRIWRLETGEWPVAAGTCEFDDACRKAH